MARAPRAANRKPKTERQQRVPLGTPQAKLAVEPRSGYMRRWINDKPGRIQKALAGGYQHVTQVVESDEEKRSENISAVVGVNEDGTPMRAFLMEIPQRLYDQDQKAKEAEIAKIDDTIRRGNVRKADPKDRNAFYVPSEGISVRTD